MPDSAMTSDGWHECGPAADASVGDSGSLLLRRGTVKWEKLSFRRKKQNALIMFKVIHVLGPVYLKRLFSQCIAEYNLRNLEGKLALLKPNTN